MSTDPLIRRFENWRGYQVEIHAELRDGQYRCTELHVRQRDGGPEVTGWALRAVPVAAMLKDLARWATNTPETPEITKELAARAPTEATLQSVARVYEAAYLVGDPPKKSVAERFEISTATAGRWIARARDAKLLRIGVSR